MRRVISGLILFLLLTTPTLAQEDQQPVPESIILQHGNAIASAQWSQDSTRVLTWDRFGIYIWDSFTGELLETVAEGEFTQVAWNGDESRVLAITEDSAMIFGDNPLTITNETIENWRPFKFFWNDDYSQFATTNLDDSASVFSAETGEHITTFYAEFNPDAARPEIINGLEWFSNDQLLVFAGGRDRAQPFARNYSSRYIAMWDMNTQAWLYQLTSQNPFSPIQWNPDHTNILTFTGGTVQNWDVTNGELVNTFDDDRIYYFSWLDNERVVITYSNPNSSRSSRQATLPPPPIDFSIVSAQTGAVLNTYSSGNQNNRETFTHIFPENGLILYADSETQSITILDEGLNRRATSIMNSVLEFSNYGPYYAAIDHLSIAIVDAQTGHILTTAIVDGQDRRSTPIVFSPDGTRFLYMNDDDHQTVLQSIVSENLDFGYTHFSDFTYSAYWNENSLQHPYHAPSSGYTNNSIAWNQSGTGYYGWGRCAYEGCLYEMDIESRQVVYQRNAPLPFAQGRLSPDGSQLFLWTVAGRDPSASLSTSDVTVLTLLLNTSTYEEIQGTLRTEFDDARWGPDSSTMALIDYGDTVTFLRENEQIAIFELDGGFAGLGWVGDAIYVVERSRPNIAVYDALTGELVRTRENTTFLEWRVGTSQLLLYTETSIELWDPFTGEVSVLVDGLSIGDRFDEFYLLNADGSQLFYSYDTDVYRVNIADGTTEMLYDSSRSWRDMSLSPDEHYLVGLSDTLNVLDLESGEVVAIAGSDGGYQWSISNSHVAFWNASELIYTNIQTQESVRVPAYGFYEAEWKPDGSQLLVRNGSGTFVWNVTD